MTDFYFKFLCFIVLLHEFDAAPRGELTKRQESQYPPLSESLSRATSALRDAGGRTFERGVQITSQALERTGQAVDTAGKYLATGVGAGVGTVIYLGSRGTELVGEGLGITRDYLQRGTAQGLRATVTACDTLSDIRRQALDNVAYYTKLGTDATNEVLDQVNEYKKEKLLNLAASVDRTIQ